MGDGDAATRAHRAQPMPSCRSSPLLTHLAPCRVRPVRSASIHSRFESRLADTELIHLLRLPTSTHRFRELLVFRRTNHLFLAAVSEVQSGRCADGAGNNPLGATSRTGRRLYSSFLVFTILKDGDVTRPSRSREAGVVAGNEQRFAQGRLALAVLQRRQQVERALR
jgi:hypothetical protein